MKKVLGFNKTEWASIFVGVFLTYVIVTWLVNYPFSFASGLFADAYAEQEDQVVYYNIFYAPAVFGQGIPGQFRFTAQEFGQILPGQFTARDFGQGLPGRAGY